MSNSLGMVGRRWGCSLVGRRRGPGNYVDRPRPHKILEVNCQMEQKSLQRKRLPPRLASGGFVLCRPKRVLSGSA